MPRPKREIRDGKMIRNLIEDQGIKYVMINNKIIDLYKQGYYEYEVKVRNKDTGFLEETGEIKKVKFDARNLTLYIGLKFLDKMDFRCYVDEIANFLDASGKMTAKRIKDRLAELEEIKIEMNNKFNSVSQVHELLEQPILTPLISKRKERGFERNRKIKIDRWYAPFDCDLKEVKNPETNQNELKANKFFIVTIYDLDLFINNILDESEFALYLYLVQCFNSDDKESKGIAQSASKISSNMGIKDVSIIQKRLDKLVNLRITDKYCKDGENFPLIHTSKPKNYNHKLITRQEPSLHYYPIYNATTITKINDLEPDPYPQDDEENKTDTCPNKMDTQSLVDSHQNKTDTDLNKMDSNIYKMDTNPNKTDSDIYNMDASDLF